MNTRLSLCMVFLSLWLTNLAQAQEISSLVADGNYSVLGSATVTSTSSVPAGFQPVNDAVAYVYDPQFHFFMRGYVTDTAFDKRASYRDYGYVVVAAAGDPGGNYPTAPTWITHTGFSAAFANGQVDLSYSYNTTYVPTMRGYQSFIIYANLENVGGPTSRYVYDDKLTFGAGNYLFTGDGPQQAATLDFAASDASQGARAIRVRTSKNSGGTHWKLMLFANGHAAAFDGIDLSAYKKLVFYAKASRNVTLSGGFGTGDDSGQLPFAPLAVTTQYKRFEIDLSSVNRTDINTPFWIYLHKAQNPQGFANLSVFFDAIELVGEASAEGAILVDRGSDSLDGVCASDGSRTGQCNLRAALELASDLPSADVWVDVAQTVSLGQITVGGDVSLFGTSTGRAVTGSGSGRLLYVQSGASVAVHDLWISGFSSLDGGAIVNDGHLTLDDVLLSDNSSKCFGTGAMSSFAMCSGGAINNRGTLVLRGGTQFWRNVVQATSSTASFTNALAGGGAIVNSGELVIDGEVLFADNASDATATSGFHSEGLAGGASASSSGGAIWSTGGSLSVVGGGVGHCVFQGNAAMALATTWNGQSGSASSAGGAISSQGVLNLPAGACTFSENSADQGPDVHTQP